MRFKSDKLGYMYIIVHNVGIHISNTIEKTYVCRIRPTFKYSCVLVTERAKRKYSPMTFLCGDSQRLLYLGCAL